MPSEQSHREQAEYNEEAALSIRDTSPDWAVTMCFYAALHWVRWYAEVKEENIEIMYRNSERHSPHDRLLNYVRDIGNTRGDRKLVNAYKNLRTECDTARYLKGGIITNSRDYYTMYKKDVDKSFENLKTVKDQLNS